MAISTQSDTTRSLSPRQFHVALPSLALAALSGLLLIGAFPHLDCGWLAWVALVPFLLTFPHHSLRSALAHGFVLGIVFFGGLMYWIGIFAAHAVGPALGAVAWAGSALSQAATCVVFALGAQMLRRRSAVWFWGVPALWTVLEWTRQFGILGTTWGDLAFTQHRMLTLLQCAKLTGPWGLSFLIVLISMAASELARHLLRRMALAPEAAHAPSWKMGGHIGAALALFLCALAYGRFQAQAEHLRPAFVAAALQGNINQNVVLTPAYEQRVLETFDAQCRQAKARGAALTVWPETAVPGYLRDDPQLFLPIARDAARNNQFLLVGARDVDQAQKKDTNTLFLVSPRGAIAGAYSKRHLVPFGEYVPLRAQFPILDKLHLSIYDMAPGASQQPLMDAGAPIGKLGIAICYDSTYSGLMRAQVARGANLLAVTTDDTWFGHTAAAGQHTAMAALDASSTDRYLVRCAATGISQIIDPTGRVLAASALFVPDVVSAPVQSRTTRTFYVAHGDWFAGLCGVVLAVCFALSQTKKQPPAPAGEEG